MTAAENNADILRRLDELATDLRGLRADLDKTYVRQDVWRGAQKLATQEARETAAHVLAKADAAARKADEVEERVAASETAVKDAEKDRRSIRRLVGLALFSAFAGPIVTALIARAMS